MIASMKMKDVVCMNDEVRNGWDTGLGPDSIEACGHIYALLNWVIIGSSNGMLLV